MIKGMEMPENCFECNMGGRGEALFCFAKSPNFTGYVSDEKRPDWCPLVEEKKGRWVRVGGFVTPGGDPTWRCSECGKGQHTWGIEGPTYGGSISDHQWVACPNCGAVMEDEVW